MLIYGSYFKKGTKIAGTAISVVSLDTLVALIAAIIVFSAGVEGAAGPALAFVAMPSVFASMPWGNVWATLFFLLLALAALSSTISMHEAVTSYFVEKRGMSRKRGAWIVTILAMVLATFASLSLGVLDDVKVLNLNFFDLLDKFTSIVMLPLLGILTAVFVGWLWKKEDMRAELTAEGGIDRKSYPIVRFLLRWVCPLLVSVVFVFGIYDFVDKQLHPEQAEGSATTEQVQKTDTDTKLIVNSQSNVLRVGKERLKASDLNAVHANKANFKQAELEFTPISVKQQNNNNNN
jgi:NSS family neurotransmitter:Na+ symporter